MTFRENKILFILDPLQLFIPVVYILFSSYYLLLRRLVRFLFPYLLVLTTAGFVWPFRGSDITGSVFLTNSKDWYKPYTNHNPKPDINFKLDFNKPDTNSKTDPREKPGTAVLRNGGLPERRTITVLRQYFNSMILVCLCSLMHVISSCPSTPSSCFLSFKRAFQQQHSFWTAGTS